MSNRGRGRLKDHGCVDSIRILQGHPPSLLKREIISSYIMWVYVIVVKYG